MIDPLFDENFNIWIMLHQVIDAMNYAREKELREYGLTRMEIPVLFYAQIIERTTDKKATAAEISRWLFRKPHSTSELAKRMEKKGLVKRVKDPVKKNMVRITLTEKGQQLYNRAMEGQLITRLISCLSKEEREALWTCLGKLRNNAFKELGLKDKLPFPQFA